MDVQSLRWYHAFSQSCFQGPGFSRIGSCRDGARRVGHLTLGCKRFCRRSSYLVVQQVAYKPQHLAPHLETVRSLQIPQPYTSLCVAPAAMMSTNMLDDGNHQGKTASADGGEMPFPTGITSNELDASSDEKAVTKKRKSSDMVCLL